MPFPPKPDIADKNCKACGTPLTRKRYGKTLESYGRYLAREHCSQSCANTKAEVTKGAHHWRARKHKRDACENCGAIDNLHVHHRDRDHANDDPSNLVTLCDSCHLELHWREDREQRLACNPWVQARRPSICEICGGEFFPRHKRTRTCSPACKAILLSRSQPVTGSGYRGVYWDAPRGKWQARVKRNGKFVALGRFPTPEAAARAIADMEVAS